MSRIWQTVIGITVSLLLLYWALHDVSPGALWQHVRSANPLLLLVSITVQTGAFLIRAARWHVFLAPALATTGFRTRFGSTCVGFMANNLLPARVGEFARAYALSRSEPISVSASFGSLVVERLFDALTLASFLAAPVLLPGFIDAPGLDERLANKLLALFLVFGAGVLALGLLIWKPDMGVRLFRSSLGRLLPQRLRRLVTESMRAFIVGLGAIRRPGLMAAGIAWSVFHWCWGAGAYWLGMRAFEIQGPGYLGALFVQSVNAFAVAIPSSPGFFGPFEASVRLGLAPFAVDPTQAVSFAAAFHIGTFIPVTLLGVYYVGRLGLSWREVEHSEEIVEERG